MCNKVWEKEEEEEGSQVISRANRRATLRDRNVDVAKKIVRWPNGCN